MGVNPFMTWWYSLSPIGLTQTAGKKHCH